MAFEGLICPACSGQLDEEELKKQLICLICKTNLKQKKFLAFLEYLMMVGIVPDLDFFDETLYGDEIEHKTVEEKELEDFTNPADYEDKSEKLKNYDEAVDLKEVTTDEESFRVWEGIDEDWEDFNKKNKK
jgi:reverse gyrase|tara:strand:- start:2080 stop:2472 length:393 start_codon:yes stop_codon:yes gene_type:complete